MFVTDARGRTRYLSLESLIIEPAEPADPFAELIKDLNSRLAPDRWPD
jgi:hypothetical protein